MTQSRWEEADSFLTYAVLRDKLTLALTTMGWRIDVRGHIRALTDKGVCLRIRYGKANVSIDANIGPPPRKRRVNLASVPYSLVRVWQDESLQWHVVIGAHKYDQGKVPTMKENQ